MAEPGSVPSWADLTPEQRCILYEGAAGHSLVDILNGWVGIFHSEDAPYWNRKGRYVGPLADAACDLIRSGFIQIWEEPLCAGEGGLMLPGPALEAVSDHGNWWRYDPDDDEDPEEDLARFSGPAEASTGPMTTLYLVITTQEARDHGLVGFPFWAGP